MGKNIVNLSNLKETLNPDEEKLSFLKSKSHNNVPLSQKPEVNPHGVKTGGFIPGIFMNQINGQGMNQQQ